MNRRIRFLIVLGCLLGSTLLGMTLLAANNHVFSVSWWSLEGGAISTGGSYRVSGSIGQFDVEQSAGSAYTVSSGYWGASFNTLLIGIAAFDNDLGPHAPRLLKTMQEGSIGRPNVHTILLIDATDAQSDLDGMAFEIANGLVTTHTVTAWLPNATTNEINSGDATTLATFLTWARQRHPADRELLSFIGHGGTPLPELGWQTTHRTNYSNLPIEFPRTPYDQENHSYRSTPRLGEMLRTATNNGADPFDIVFFDQCFSGNLDLLYEVRDSAETIITSPNYAFASFPYDDYIAILSSTSQTTTQVADSLMSAYQNAMDDGHPNTMFAIQSDAIDTLAVAVSNLGAALIDGLQNGTVTQSDILVAVQNSRFVDTNQDAVAQAPDEYVTLYSLAHHLSQQISTPPVTTALTTILNTLDGLHSTQRSGVPWEDSLGGNYWAFNNNDTVTVLSPLPHDVTDIWRSTIYTETASLSIAYPYSPTISATIVTPLAYTTDHQWDNFIHMWYHTFATTRHPVLSPTIQPWGYHMPVARLNANPQLLTLSSDWLGSNLVLEWQIPSTLTNAEHIVLYAFDSTIARWRLHTNLPITASQIMLESPAERYMLDVLDADGQVIATGHYEATSTSIALRSQSAESTQQPISLLLLCLLIMISTGYTVRQRHLAIM